MPQEKQYFRIFDHDRKEFINPLAYTPTNGEEPSEELTDFIKINHPAMTALEMMLSNGYNWTGDHISIEGSLAEGKNPIQLCSSCSVCPDCQKKLHGENLYNKSDSGEITETTPRNVFKRFRYFINHNSYEFIDIKDFKDDINNAYGLHPLALLLTRGNGRGKTDYIGAAEGHIGAWAGCGISSSNTDPQQFYGSNYTKITFKI